MSRVEPAPARAFLLIVCRLFSRLAGAQSLVSDPARPLVRTAAYQRLIDPLLDVPDFRMHLIVRVWYPHPLYFRRFGTHEGLKRPLRREVLCACPVTGNGHMPWAIGSRPHAPGR